MKAEILPWIAKAEGDFATMEREFRARKAPNYDSVCFHAQQGIEKYLKARLVEADIYFPKMHDLGQLLNLVAPVEPMWESFRLALNRISYYAVEFRYPGAFSTREDARESVKMYRAFRKAARQSSGLLSE